MKTVFNFINKLNKEEQGSIMLMFAVVVTVVFIVAAVAIDFARYALAAEKLQTAVDSASLAASKTAYRYVDIQIYYGDRSVP